MRSVLVLAGTFAPQSAANVYYGSLRADRVVALPGGGRGRLHATYTSLAPLISSWIEQQDEPVVLVGHSQGAIHAVQFAVDNPDMVDSVVGIAGPFSGANSPNIPTYVERHLSWLAPVGLDLRGGAALLVSLQRRVAAQVVPNLTLVAGNKDLLVSVESAHALVPAETLLLDAGHSSVVQRWEVRHLLRELR